MNGMNEMIEQLTYVTEKACPDCNGEMRAFKEKNKDGSVRCPPICFHKGVDKFGRTCWLGCGYRSKNANDVKSVNDLVNDSLKARALQTFRNGSYFPSSTSKTYNMDNFKVDNLNASNEQLKAKNTLSYKVEDMLKGNIHHIFLVGSTGVGKTHLGIASVRQFIEQSNYEKKGLVVKWGALLSDVKKSFSGNQGVLASEINVKVKDYKTCGLLLIDDLGTELGQIESDQLAKTYNIELLEEILNAREDKNLIITTNLNAGQLKKVYGDRVYSRIMKHVSSDNILKFEATKDMRLSV